MDLPKLEEVKSLLNQYPRDTALALVTSTQEMYGYLRTSDMWRHTGKQPAGAKHAPSPTVGTAVGYSLADNRGSFIGIVQLEQGVKGTIAHGQCQCGKAGFAMPCRHQLYVLLRIAMGEVPLHSACASKSLPERLLPWFGEENQIRRWLGTLGSANAPTPKSLPPPPKRESVVCYMIQVGQSGLIQSIEAVEKKCLKKGGLGAGSARFTSWAEMEASPTCLLDDRDMDLWLALRQAKCKIVDASVRLPLYGDASPILEAMIRTGRCYTSSDHSRPLRLASTEIMKGRWELLPGGLQRYCASTDSRTKVAVVPGTQLWFVDPNAAEAGQLVSAEESHQIVQLLNAPGIPLSMVGQVREVMRSSMGQCLPLPREPEVKTIKPRPVLRMKWSAIQDDSVNFRSGGTAVQAWADILFDYDGHVVSLDDPAMDKVVRDDGERIVVVQRDLNAERIDRSALYAKVFPQQFERDGESAFNGRFTCRDSMGWLEFQRTQLPVLIENGWDVRFEEGWPYRLDTYGGLAVDVEEAGDWFDVSMMLRIGDREVSGIDVLRAVAMDTKLMKSLALEPSHDGDAGHYVKVGDSYTQIPRDVLRRFARLFLEISEMSSGKEEMRLPRFAVGTLAELESWPEIDFRGGTPILQALKALTEKKEERPEGMPEKLWERLWHYQRSGIQWMKALGAAGFGGIIGDDMGLGKTLQSLAFTLSEVNGGQAKDPTLVITTVNAVGEWVREKEKFTPELRHVVHMGPQRTATATYLTQFDLVITTYATLLQDADVFKEIRFHTVFADESHWFRNPNTHTARALYALQSKHRFPLTGTPTQNTTVDLWSQFHFAIPGLLGTLKWFNTNVAKPIEREGDREAWRVLQARTRPFILVRTRDQVQADLPPLQELVKTVVLQGRQRELYEGIRLNLDKRVREEIAEKGFKQSQIVVLDALLKLRQVCCDPALVKGISMASECESAKMAAFLELLEELRAEGKRCVVFSFFTTFLDLVKIQLERAGITWTEVVGKNSQKKREQNKQEFRTGAKEVILCSLKAAGEGGNLQEADTVILLDPWYNPHAEKQAIARVHRQGQEKKVAAWRLVVQGSVEERILAIQSRKLVLGKAVQDGALDAPTSLTEADIQALLAPLSDRTEE